MRHLPRVILATLIALAVAWWLWRDLLVSPPPAPARATERQRQFGFEMPLAMAAKLERPLPNPFEFDGPLDRVLKDLGKTGDVEIEPNWQQIKQAGLSKNKPIRLDVSGKRFGDALLAVLAEAGAPGLPLTAHATGDAVLISPAGTPQATRLAVYDVRELAGSADALIGQIKSMVDPRSWAAPAVEAAPGVRELPGHVRHVNGQLIVVQTEANQREVDHLIHDVRQARRIRVFALRTTALTVGVAACALIVPAVVRRYRVLREPGQCEHCGYDLRASTGLCPECGHPIPAHVMRMAVRSR